MERVKNFMQRLTEGADLPGEPVPGMSIVELMGNRRVLIEHHRGITEYGTQQIRVRVSYGEICVCGQDLEMARMSAGQLVIAGQIHALTLLGRDG